MLRRSVRFFLVLVACAATTSMTSVAQALPPTELTGEGGPVIPLKNAAMIVKTTVGYRYIAGQQNSNLTVTQVGNKVLYLDTGTRELRTIPRSCSRITVPHGISALCNISAKFVGDNKMFLEVWPRLGDDKVDGSTLSSLFRLWVLADTGFDIVRGGDGDDFVNGAASDDQIWGGAGDDWIRSGIGNDTVWGDTGDDKIVAGNDKDVVHGGDGNDWVGGGTGRDILWADSGQNTISCGDGNDDAYLDQEQDRFSQCENVSLPAF